MTRAFIALFFILICAIQASANECLILLSLVEKLQTPSPHRKVELAAPEFSWSEKVIGNSPQSKEFVSEIEKELKTTKNNYDPKELQALKNLAVEIRRENYPLRKLQELLFRYYDLKADIKRESNYFIFNLFVPYTDETRLFEGSVEKLKLKPQLVYTFQTPELLDHTLAMHAGVFLVEAKHKTFVSFGGEKGVKRVQNLTVRDFQYARKTIRRINHELIPDNMDKQTLSERRQQYELYKKVVEKVISENDVRIQVAMRLSMFEDTHEQGLFLFEIYKRYKSGTMDRFRLYPNGSSFFDGYRLGEFGEGFQKLNLSQDEFSEADRRLKEIIIETVEAK